MYLFNLGFSVYCYRNVGFNDVWTFGCKTKWKVSDINGIFCSFVSLRIIYVCLYVEHSLLYASGRSVFVDYVVSDAVN